MKLKGDTQVVAAIGIFFSGAAFGYILAQRDIAWNETYIAALITGVFTIGAATVAVIAATAHFRRQKEYETVQRRYLDQGLDIVMATAQASLDTFSHNWARCLEILKTFRDI